MKNILILGLLFLLPLPVLAQGFRGLPYAVKIDSVDLRPHPTDPASNLVKVCYRFATTVPILNYTDLASQALHGIKVIRKDADGGLINGDRQPQGVQFQFSVQGFSIFAYLNSEARNFNLAQLAYFNSGVRTAVGIEKPLLLTAYDLSYSGMLDPQYEWVSSCEDIPFGKAYSERYVRSLFRGPGPIATLEGSARFDFSARLVKLPFNSSPYVTPVFGLSPLESDDQRMIALAHYVNSLNAVKENLDETTLNTYLAEHADILKAFEERYGIHVDLPIDAAKLIDIIKEVAGIKNLPTER